MSRIVAMNSGLSGRLQCSSNERRDKRHPGYKKKRIVQNDSYRLYHRSHDFFIRKQKGKTDKHLPKKTSQSQNWSIQEKTYNKWVDPSKFNVPNLCEHRWVAIDSGDCAGMAGIAECCDENKGTIIVRVGGAFLEVKHTHLRALDYTSTYTRNMETFVSLYSATDSLECDLEVLRIISDFVDCPLHYDTDTNINSKLQLQIAQQSYYGYSEHYVKSSNTIINRVGHNDELVITSSVTRLKESWRKIGLKNGCNDLMPYRDLQIMCSLLVRLKKIDEELGVAEVYANTCDDWYYNGLEYLVPLDCLYLPYHRTF